MSIAGVWVRRVVWRERRSIANRLEFDPCLQAHDHALAVGREARRKGHARKIADDFALAGFDVEEIDARIALPERHIGDFLRRGREARRQHEIVAARQVAHARAVLIHDREALDAALLRPGFVDEHDAGVEIALLAGEPFVDRVRDDVADAPPIVGRREILLAGLLLAAEHVPQPELGFQSAVVLAREAAGRPAPAR